MSKMHDGPHVFNWVVSGTLCQVTRPFLPPPDWAIFALAERHRDIIGISGGGGVNVHDAKILNYH